MIALKQLIDKLSVDRNLIDRMIVRMHVQVHLINEQEKIATEDAIKIKRCVLAVRGVR